MADLIDKDVAYKTLCKERDMQKEIFNTYHNIERRGIMQGFMYACEIIRKQNSVNRWIPVEDALPEQTGYYLVCDSTAEFDNIRGRQDVSKYVIGRHGGHWYGAIRREYITHWMPLPSTEGLT